MTYKEFCDINEDIIFDEIDESIKSLSLIKRIENQILSIIYDNAHLILEKRYIDSQSTYEDMKYDELK